MSAASPDGQRTIVLLTGSSLCHNPRAVKAATALSRAGYRVRVLGAWLDADFKTRDQAMLSGLPFMFVPVVDTTRPGAACIARAFRRVRRRAAQIMHDTAGWQSAHQLGITAGPLLRQARRHPADLYIAHSEPALCAARVLLHEGRRVGVDMEDWFSEDLPEEARRHRPIRLLRAVEGELLRRGSCAFCPSEAMSAALAELYGCCGPTPIYNAFPWADRETLDGGTSDRCDRSIPSIYWFSTTLGPGRGLENLVAALPLLRAPCEVHLRGRDSPGFRAWVLARLPVPWRERVFFWPLAENAALLPRIAEHDIGFAGELTYCRNKELTISTKILHYLLGGLAVLASDTQGQREVARQAPGAVLLYRAGDAADLARQLDVLLASPARRQSMRAAALAGARDVFCWERQEARLCEVVDRALAA